MNDWMPRLKGLNRAAITRVEATTSCDSCTSWPVADMLAMMFNLIASCYGVTLTTTAAITRAKVTIIMITPTLRSEISEHPHLSQKGMLLFAHDEQPYRCSTDEQQPHRQTEDSRAAGFRQVPSSTQLIDDAYPLAPSEAVTVGEVGLSDGCRDHRDCLSALVTKRDHLLTPAVARSGTVPCGGRTCGARARGGTRRSRRRS